jgi:hypothetical protein
MGLDRFIMYKVRKIICTIKNNEFITGLNKDNIDELQRKIYSWNILSSRLQERYYRE